MLERFLKYIEEEGLCRKQDRLLLAVSGGMDSMFMMRLFSQSSFLAGVAHCNFKLRGEESDQDQEFVKQEAEKLKLPFYTVSFSTESYAGRRKISTQMAARELRYEWFEQLARKEGYPLIAVAHHLNDLVETMLINLIRGTGPAGMHGIFPKKGNIIRPLLAFTREEIAAEVRRQAIPYREESSNASDKYLRNRLRHQVIPVFQELNPNLEHTFAANARHFLEAEQLIDQHIAPYRELIKRDNESWRLPCQALEEQKISGSVLFHLLRPFGFNAATISGIMEACRAQSGKQFFSPTHRLVKDRDDLIISPLPATGNGDDDRQGSPASLFDELFEGEAMDAKDLAFGDGNTSAFLDMDKLQFPLEARYWKKGDRFHPLGMNGRKKLSDFFVDLKIPLQVKEQIPLVLSGGEIAWVAGYRIAHPFRVTTLTKKVYRIKLKIPKIN